jgi:predicted phosphate transport protein (TIGR00153 family)
MKLALVPRTTEFYDLFTRAGENMLEVAKLAEQRFREVPDTSVRQTDIKALETRGDDLTREIIELLNRQYITPFDREDIYALAKAIDDVIDYIDEASDLLGLYKVQQKMDQAVEQCRVLVSAAEHLARALADLRQLRRAEAHLVQVKSLEDEGDTIVREAIAALFENEAFDPKTIIRWKDIFEALEEAIDACETAADLVGNIVVKNV